MQFRGDSFHNTSIYATATFPALPTDGGYGMIWIGSGKTDIFTENTVWPPCVSDLHLGLDSLGGNTEYTCIWGMQDCNRISIKNVVFSGRWDIDNLNYHQGIRLNATARWNDGTRGDFDSNNGNYTGVTPMTGPLSMGTGDGVKKGPFRITLSDGARYDL